MEWYNTMSYHEVKEDRSATRKELRTFDDGTVGHHYLHFDASGLPRIYLPSLQIEWMDNVKEKLEDVGIQSLQTPHSNGFFTVWLKTKRDAAMAKMVLS